MRNCNLRTGCMYICSETPSAASQSTGPRQIVTLLLSLVIKLCEISSLSRESGYVSKYVYIRRIMLICAGIFRVMVTR